MTEERAWVEALPQHQRPLAFALLFSAKESIYKTLNPSTGVFLGYGDARIWLEGDPGAETEGAWRWELLAAAGPEYPPGYLGQGRWCRDDARVLTAAWVPVGE